MGPLEHGNNVTTVLHCTIFLRIGGFLLLILQAVLSDEWALRREALIALKNACFTTSTVATLFWLLLLLKPEFTLYIV